MRVLRLTRSKTPLSTASILELFQKIGACLETLRYEFRTSLSPASGDLFLLDGLDTPVADGQTYAGPPDRFNEDRFEVAIDKTSAAPYLFRFVYYNRADRYRLVHYLLCEKKPLAPSESPAAPCNTLAEHFLEQYRIVQQVLFAPAAPSADTAPKEELDHVYWTELVRRHLSK